MQRVLGRSHAPEIVNGCHILLSRQAQILRRAIADLSERRKGLETKYVDKLLERVKREGLSSVEELRVKVTSHSQIPKPPILGDNNTAHHKERRKLQNTPVRKDSSPMKPLADIMDLEKILSKNHTADQVSTLWMSYHASRSQGTGRGYLSATIPLASYHKMATLATNYPSFLLPLSRPPPVPDTADPAYEFFFLQWTFYDTPPHHSYVRSFPFDELFPGPSLSAPRNPSCSTVLFTPLQEYKLRRTFSQPHLVLTHYTDLAMTHGIVLMRGELTASLSSPEKYLLPQIDAQLLAMGVQRFYLPTDDAKSERRIELIRSFHETPASFRWEDLLAFADLTA